MTNMTEQKRERKRERESASSSQAAMVAHLWAGYAMLAPFCDRWHL